MSAKPDSVGIAMIATNRYLELWFSAAKSLESFAFLNYEKVVIHLFTNRCQDARSWAKSNLARITLKTHQITGWGWPEATLFRYEFIKSYSNVFDEELLMYLDSDMILVGDIEKLLRPSDWINGLAFVQHPGFHRSKGLKGVRDVLVNPRLLSPKFKSVISGVQGLGTWETNKSSLAYTPRKLRKNYVHGAIWFGLKSKFLSMCNELALNVETDWNNNFIAKWHDESHLNWYFASHPSTLLDCRLSSVKNFKHLDQDNSLVFSAEKNFGEVREISNLQF